MEESLKQKVLEALDSNSTAKWLLYEIQNLKRAFPEPFEVVMPRLNNPVRHSMEDTIDNLYSVFFDILSIDLEENSTYEVYDFIDTSIEMVLDGILLKIKEV